MKDPRSYENIVFDMGHVLCEYSSRRAVERQTSDETVIKEIRNVVFCSYEWCLLDMGLMDEQQVAQFTLPRLSSDAARSIAAEALRTWQLYNLWPKTGMERVVRDLKARGQRVYILSNAGARLRDVWRDVLPAPDAYDGIIFSALRRCLKPQKEIYSALFNEYHLLPSECLFIDDLAWNVRGSEENGMDAWQFKSGDVNELRAVLGLPEDDSLTEQNESARGYH